MHYNKAYDATVLKIEDFKLRLDVNGFTVQPKLIPHGVIVYIEMSRGYTHLTVDFYLYSGAIVVKGMLWSGVVFKETFYSVNEAVRFCNNLLPSK